MEQSTSLVTLEHDTEVKAFFDQAVGLREYAEGLVIATAEDLKPVTNDLSVIAKLKKALEEKRREYVVPLQTQVKDLNDAFKILMAPIEVADKMTRDKILAFNAEQERRRKEQEEINRLKVEAAEKEMNLNGELSQSVDLVEVSPEAPIRTVTDMGTTGQRANWKYQVFDFELLPREYKMVDGAQLSAIAKRHHDKKEIPGVRFYDDPIIQVTAR